MCVFGCGFWLPDFASFDPVIDSVFVNSVTLILGPASLPAALYCVCLFPAVFAVMQRRSPEAKGGGGAVSIELAEHVSIAGSTFAHNTASGSNANGGAVMTRSCTAVDVRGCTFVNNTAEVRVG